MSVYDYECSGCGMVREVRHSIKESPAVTCPACGQAMVRRIAVDVPLAVKGGTVSGAVHQAQAATERAEVASAHQLVGELGAWRAARKAELAAQPPAKPPEPT